MPGCFRFVSGALVWLGGQASPFPLCSQAVNLFLRCSLWLWWSARWHGTATTSPAQLCYIRKQMNFSQIHGVFMYFPLPTRKVRGGKRFLQRPEAEFSSIWAPGPDAKHLQRCISRTITALNNKCSPVIAECGGLVHIIRRALTRPTKNRSMPHLGEILFFWGHGPLSL